MPMSKEFQAGYAVGLHEGWEHANYVDSVDNRTITDSEAEADRMAESYSHGDQDGWLTGFRDGIDGYNEGWVSE